MFKTVLFQMFLQIQIPFFLFFSLEMFFPLLHGAVVIIQFFRKLLAGQIKQMFSHFVKTVEAALRQRNAVYIAAKDILGEKGRNCTGAKGLMRAGKILVQVYSHQTFSRAS